MKGRGGPGFYYGKKFAAEALHSVSQGSKKSRHLSHNTAVADPVGTKGVMPPPPFYPVKKPYKDVFIFQGSCHPPAGFLDPLLC